MPIPNHMIRVALALLICCATAPVLAAPNYDFDRPQLESVLHDLRAWLPGEWSSFPQVWYDRNVTTPAAGEHEHWFRTFALIEAPHIGDTVFYGQVNLGGPDGPILARSQVLYKAYIDDQKGVVTILGQPVAEPERFADLHRKPDLWREARMPDEAGLNCRFDWRRHGRQLVGVLDNLDREDPDKEPGTCTYVAANKMDFFADAEWLLSPDELWLYDINKIGGVQFVGRSDRTHLRLYRARGYRCTLESDGNSTDVTGHDRGFVMPLDADDAVLTAMLLRAWYPDAERGLVDELRLWRLQDGVVSAPAGAAVAGGEITARIGATRVACGPR